MVQEASILYNKGSVFQIGILIHPLFQNFFPPSTGLSAKLLATLFPSAKQIMQFEHLGFPFKDACFQPL